MVYEALAKILNFSASGLDGISCFWLKKIFVDPKKVDQTEK